MRSANDKAILAAEKAYRHNIEGRAMKHACGAFMQALLSDERVVEAIAECQANGWEYGTHPKEKARIVIQSILQQVEA